MATQFAIEPSASVFRSVVAGKNAVSPASPNDVIFDAYGPNCAGVTQSGMVAFSAFTGPTPYSPLPPNAVNASYYGYSVNFPTTYSYVPLVTISIETTGGVWAATFNSGVVSYYNVGDILFPQGTAATGAVLVGFSSILLYLTVVNFVNPTGYTAPSQFSYRVIAPL